MQIIAGMFPYCFAVFIVATMAYFVLDHIEQKEQQKILRLEKRRVQRESYRNGFTEGRKTAWMKKY